MKKKKLFLDVDGVLLCFDSSFHRWVNREAGEEGLFHSGYTFAENFSKHPELDPEKLGETFVFSEFMSALEPLVPPRDFNLVTSRFETVLVTNLPSSALPRRIRNLENLGMNYAKVFCAGNYHYGEAGYPPKSKVVLDQCDDGEIPVFLDDLPENCEDVKTNVPGSEVFLMHSPYNDAPSSFPRIRHWNEFRRALES